MRKFFFLLVATAALTLALMVALAQREGTVGLVGGALSECPGGACVNSQIGGPETRIEPLFVGPDAASAWQALQLLIANQSRLRLRRVDGPWMAVRARIPWLPIYDDVEFLWVRSGGIIHIRSASRLGFANMGTHRAVVDSLRTDLAAALAAPETQ